MLVYERVNVLRIGDVHRNELIPSNGRAVVIHVGVFGFFF